MPADFIRIGEKVISYDKIGGITRDILGLRAKGYSQQEVANILNLDRTFISRLEKIGEVRKGEDIAVIGFPILNKDELAIRLVDAGVDYIFLMTEKERNEFVSEQSGVELFNNVLTIAAKVRKYQNVIAIGSEYRNKITRSLLDNHVYNIDIGESPIKEDIYVDPQRVMNIINMIKR